MKNEELFKMLDKFNPTNEQLKTYMELRKGIFPLPLYVRDSKGNYRIVRRLKDGLTVEGIVTERGIYLKTPISPSKLAAYNITVDGLYQEAQKVHPDARPLTRDDVMGSEYDTLIEMLDKSSSIYMTVQKLKQMGIHFFETFPDIITLPQDHCEKTLLHHIVGCDCEGTHMVYADVMYLFIPKEKMPKNIGPAKGITSEGNGLPTSTPAKTEDTQERFPLSLFLKDQNGRFFVADKMLKDCTVEGIVTKDTIILRQVIHPSKINKEEPTVQDLKDLAKRVHPEAMPLYHNDLEGGILSLLLVDRRRYNQTADTLRKYGIFMPDINKAIHFIGGRYNTKDESAFVNHICVNWWTGSSRIKYVNDMILAIPRTKVDPFYK